MTNIRIGTVPMSDLEHMLLHLTAHDRDDIPDDDAPRIAGGVPFDADAYETIGLEEAVHGDLIVTDLGGLYAYHDDYAPEGAIRVDVRETGAVVELPVDHVSRVLRVDALPDCPGLWRDRDGSLWWSDGSRAVVLLDSDPTESDDGWTGLDEWKQWNVRDIACWAPFVRVPVQRPSSWVAVRGAAAPGSVRSRRPGMSRGSGDVR